MHEIGVLQPSIQPETALPACRSGPRTRSFGAGKSATGNRFVHCLWSRDCPCALPRCRSDAGRKTAPNTNRDRRSACQVRPG